jgi:uncharacterized 2Fe-2S/4Fe-4S cluster protein (DUF4445 family)
MKMDKALKTDTVKIEIAGEKEALQAPVGANLYHLLSEAGYAIASACGGIGICGKCRVRFLANAKPPTESEKLHLLSEELAAGWRLSCQHRLHSDIAIEIPHLDEATDAKERMSRPCQVALEVGIEKRYVELALPTKDDQRAATVRIEGSLHQGRLDFPLSVLRKLPSLLNEANYKVTVTVKDNQVLDIEKGDTAYRCCGVAIDIGTTTLAGYLLDLCTGEELAIRSQMNPQHRFGADVISRIKHVRDHGKIGLQELQDAIVKGLNMLTRQLILAASVSSHQIYNVTIVGNPTMLHLLLGIDPRGIDQSPYIPIIRDGLVVPAHSIGLNVNQEGSVWMLPSVAGYVGSDITAGILHTGIDDLDGLNLFVDIGTNAEIVLGNRDRLLSCSTPAGPAFEGAGIKCGMRATPGAISHVKLQDGNVSLQIIGQGDPKGICGSGLIDAVSELLRIGQVDEKGRLLDDPHNPYAHRVNRDERGHTRFLLSKGDNPIYLTQADVRELQLAKGAVAAGVESLLERWGSSMEDVDRVFLSGAFGTYVRRESVLQIGMLPGFPLEKISSVGNAAGQGAKLGLLSRKKWEQVQKLVECIEYFELSFYKRFSDIYMHSMYFPKLLENNKGRGNGKDN